MAEKPAPAPAKAKGASQADVAHKPFGVLLASAPPKMTGGISSGILSTIFHVALAATLVSTTMGSGEEEEEEVTQIVEIVEETSVPPPPPPPPPPELQAEMPDVTVISQLEMPTVILSAIPAPQMDVVFDARALAAGTGTVTQAAAARQDSTEANPDQPGFTPMTVRPQLLNSEEVQRVLIREYPAVLRDAGIGGAPVLWLYIGTNGAVERTQVQETSGFDALDQAAANVAQVMRFTPAQNRDQTVAVWVQIPIRFQVIN
ncbi:MAG: TonB family protein [Longimicrobiales bacterium]